MMPLHRCHDLFEIENVRDVSLEYIHKKYRKLCLKYHPDKGLEKTSDKFIQIQQAYDRLVQEKESQPPQYSCENTEDESIYESLFSLFRVDNLERIVDWVLDYQQARCGETVLHVTLDQVLNKEVYPYDGVYIPLWHRRVSRHKLIDEDEKKETYVIQIHDIPSHIQLLDNNDLLVYVDKEVFNLHKKEVYICVTENKWVSFTMNDEIQKKNYHVLLGQGIPKINKDDIYDVSEMTNVILCFTTQTNH
jgi:hypothetical protein